MADTSQQNCYELHNLQLLDNRDHTSADQAEAKQYDAKIMNDMGHKDAEKLSSDELKQSDFSNSNSKQQENDSHGRIPNGKVSNRTTEAEWTEASEDEDEVNEIFIEDIPIRENEGIEIAETEKSWHHGTVEDGREPIAKSTKLSSDGSTSTHEQQENGSNGKVCNNSDEGTAEPFGKEIDEILIEDGSLRKNGSDSATRARKPERFMTDTESEYSDNDETYSFYQEPQHTDKVHWGNRRDTATSLGCCLRLRCCSRTDTFLQGKFEKLCFCIHNNDAELMIELLNREDEKNQAKLLTMEDKEGLPCLMKAITRQSFNCLKLLLKRYKDIMPSFNKYHIKPLGGLELENKTNLFHLAAEFVNQTEIIDHLLEHCASKALIVNKADQNGVTPLLVACKTRNYITMNRLVKEKDAKIDHIGERGDSPIYYAAKSECAEILTLFLNRFLEQGPSAKDYEELFTKRELYGGKGTILQALLESQSVDTLWNCFKNEREQELIRKCLSKELGWDNCFLHKVCRKPLVAVIDMAVSKNSSLLHERDSEGMTLLMGATEEGQLEIVEFILAHENGGNTVSWKRESDKRTALMIACENDFDEIAKLIMERSIVNLDAVDEFDRNVFHFAAKKSKVLEAILDVCFTNDKYKNYKETLKAKDKNGYTSLHYAAGIGSPKNVELLLRHKVPYGIANSCNARLALHEASCRNLRTVKALVKFVRKNIGEEAKKKFINATDCKLQTSLHIAASYGKYTIVEYLLKHGATVKGDYEMDTPLHLAAASGCAKKVEWILRYFPNIINHENRVGETPAMFAAVEGKTEVLQLLLNSKASLQVHSNSVKNQKTCLEWAVANKMSDTASMILDHNDWKADMENASVGADGLLAMMVKSMPQVATAVLSKCVNEIGQGDKKFDFFALQTVEGEVSNSNDPENPETKTKVTSMQALEAMIDNSSDKCLRHDVVQEFLDQKWTKRIRIWYLAALILYIVFLTSLTTYIGLVKSGAYSSICVGITRWICGVCTCFGVLTEIFKFLYRKFTYKFSTFAAYVNLATMYICVFIFLTLQGGPPWEAGAIAIFLAWINFIWFLKRIPAIGIYMIMVKKIFDTFVKALIPVMFFIMAFAMTFFTLQQSESKSNNKTNGFKTNGFKTIPHSLLTSFAMMAGEISYHEGDSFFGQTSGKLGITITVFWVISVIVLTILIMNLLTALAVGDTGEILRRSMGEKRLQRAMFVVDLEKFLNTLPWMGANFVEPLYKSPKSKQSCPERFCSNLREMVCPKSIVPRQSEQEKTSGCQCSSVMEQLAELKASLAVIQKHVLSKENKQRRPSVPLKLNSRKLLEKQRSYHYSRSLPSQRPVSSSQYFTHCTRSLPSQRPVSSSQYFTPLPR